MTDDSEIVAVHPGENGQPDTAVCRGKAPFLDPAFCETYFRHHSLPPAVKGCTPEEIRESLHFFQAVLGSVGGKIGGRSRSKAKIAAARENGKRGGRPRGSATKNRSAKEAENDKGSKQHGE